MSEVMGMEIVAMIKAVRDQEPYERTDCPNDGWPLQKHEDGTLVCPFDGWQAR